MKRCAAPSAAAGRPAQDPSRTELWTQKFFLSSVALSRLEARASGKEAPNAAVLIPGRSRRVGLPFRAPLRRAPPALQSGAPRRAGAAEDRQKQG